MTAALGVEPDCPFTAGALKKVVYAGSQSASFVQATQDLETLAELSVSRERVQRWTKRIGCERVAEAQEQAEAYQALPLPARRTSPTDQIPQVACVMMDGGRIQIRPRSAASAESSSGFWKETLVGCCLSMTGAVHQEDPCPTLPRSFVDRQRISQLARQIKGTAVQTDEQVESTEESPADRAGRPTPLVKSVVATRQGIEALGARLVAAAYARGFHAAPRKAFVADGSATNWSVHQKHFSHYTPILDFVHALCYVYAAAHAARSAAEGWSAYRQWAQWLWEGRVEPLLAALTTRSDELGPPDEHEPESSPRRLVAEALRYLTHQKSRMNYADYRRQGLPITSSHIESTIKQINRRVKGSEKFWDQGAEPLLQLAADHLSETQPLRPYWKRRPFCLPITRSYHTAA
jgi:hypothetical protein